MGWDLGYLRWKRSPGKNCASEDNQPSLLPSLGPPSLGITLWGGTGGPRFGLGKGQAAPAPTSPCVLTTGMGATESPAVVELLRAPLPSQEGFRTDNPAGFGQGGVHQGEDESRCPR